MGRIPASILGFPVVVDQSKEWEQPRIELGAVTPARITTLQGEQVKAWYFDEFAGPPAWKPGLLEVITGRKRFGSDDKNRCAEPPPWEPVCGYCGNRWADRQITCNGCGAGYRILRR